MTPRSALGDFGAREPAEGEGEEVPESFRWVREREKGLRVPVDWVIAWIADDLVELGRKVVVGQLAGQNIRPGLTSLSDWSKCSHGFSRLLPR